MEEGDLVALPEGVVVEDDDLMFYLKVCLWRKMILLLYLNVWWWRVMILLLAMFNRCNHFMSRKVSAADHLNKFDLKFT